MRRYRACSFAQLKSRKSNFPLSWADEQLNIFFATSIVSFCFGWRGFASSWLSVRCFHWQLFCMLSLEPWPVLKHEKQACNFLTWIHFSATLNFWNLEQSVNLCSPSQNKHFRWGCPGSIPVATCCEDGSLWLLSLAFCITQKHYSFWFFFQILNNVD